MVPSAILILWKHELKPLQVKDLTSGHFGEPVARPHFETEPLKSVFGTVTKPLFENKTVERNVCPVDIDILYLSKTKYNVDGCLKC